VVPQASCGRPTLCLSFSGNSRTGTSFYGYRCVLKMALCALTPLEGPEWTLQGCSLEWRAQSRTKVRCIQPWSPWPQSLRGQEMPCVIPGLWQPVWAICTASWAGAAGETEGPSLSPRGPVSKRHMSGFSPVCDTDPEGSSVDGPRSEKKQDLNSSLMAYRALGTPVPLHGDTPGWCSHLCRRWETEAHRGCGAGPESVLTREPG
jgi:hypothetical protein